MNRLTITVLLLQVTGLRAQDPTQNLNIPDACSLLIRMDGQDIHKELKF